MTVNKLRNSAKFCYSLVILEGIQKRLFQLTIGVLFHNLNSLFSANGQSVGLTSAKVDFFILLVSSKFFADVDRKTFKVCN